MKSLSYFSFLSAFAWQQLVAKKRITNNIWSSNVECYVCAHKKLFRCEVWKQKSLKITFVYQRELRSEWMKSVWLTWIRNCGWVMHALFYTCSVVDEIANIRVSINNGFQPDWNWCRGMQPYLPGKRNLHQVNDEIVVMLKVCVVCSEFDEKSYPSACKSVQLGFL